MEECDFSLKTFLQNGLLLSFIETHFSNLTKTKTLGNIEEIKFSVYSMFLLLNNIYKYVIHKW
jgi:hypothetical protein